jgi:hypothetical protein
MGGVALLIFHGLAAMFLLGALTHQVFAAWSPAPVSKQTFVASARRVRPHVYTNAIIVLYLTTWIVGMLIYPIYNLGPRPGFKLDFPNFFGLFEIKEHFAALGAGMLPCYWQVMRFADASTRTTARILTSLLAFIVWCDFLAGHLLNNLKGL